jgi:hypothetical protein
MPADRVRKDSVKIFFKTDRGKSHMNIIKTMIDSFFNNTSSTDRLLIVICVLIGIIATILNIPEVKGKIGEGAIKQRIKKLPADTYKICNDIMIKNSKGGTSQIDHIVISKYGLFVVETKNYQGWITGGERSEKWTQTIYKKKSQFFNPLRQNYGHIRALMELLDLPQDKFIPIIAFSDKAELKVNVTSHVVYYSDVIKVIQNYKNIILTDNQVDNIYETLTKNNIVEAEQRRNHTQSIKQNVQIKNQQIANGICPKCGGNLVLRNGKYGKFYGCSNYPKCRFVKSDNSKNV